MADAYEVARLAALRTNGILKSTESVRKLLAASAADMASPHLATTLASTGALAALLAADAERAQLVKSSHLERLSALVSLPDPEQSFRNEVRAELRDIRERVEELEWLGENHPKSIELRARISRLNGQVDQAMGLPTD